MRKNEIIEKIQRLDKESVNDFSEYAQLSEETLMELVRNGEKYLTTQGLNFIYKEWKNIDELLKQKNR